MGNVECGMGNEEWGMRNGEWGMGNGEWEIESWKLWSVVIPTNHLESTQERFVDDVIEIPRGY